MSNEKISKTGQFWMTYAKFFGLIQLIQHVAEINFDALYSFALFEVTLMEKWKIIKIMLVGCP